MANALTPELLEMPPDTYYAASAQVRTSLSLEQYSHVMHAFLGLDESLQRDIGSWTPGMDVFTMEAPLTNLEPFIAYLREHGLPHRVTVLWDWTHRQG